MAKIKCPECGSEKIGKIGPSHRVGSVAKIGNKPPRFVKDFSLQ